MDETNYYANAHSIEHYHAEIMQRGRSRGTGCVCLSQRPVNINNMILSESQHFFIFTLSLDDDIVKLKGVIPKDMHKAMYNLDEFQYVYAGTNRIRNVCDPVVMK